MNDAGDFSDAQLVLCAARYREDALAEIYRRHGAAVFGLTRRLIGDRTSAEDVTQEVFLRLWREPDRFDPARGALRSFLLAQAHSRAVDLIRSQRARTDRELRDSRRSVEGRYDLEHEVWDHSLADHVSKAMASLPVDEKAAIELAYFEGYTYREVATMLAEPEGTVKSRIRSGLRRMRSTLVQSGVNEP